MTPLSWLYVPGDVPTMLEKAPQRGAHALIVDLEDAVSPAAKPEARRVVASWLAEQPSATESTVQLWVRLNPMPMAEEDLEAVIGPALTGVILAKTASVQELADLDRRLTELEAARGLPDGAVGVIPLVETASAFLQLAELAGAPRVVRLQMGEADFAADLGLAPAQDEREWDPMRAQVVLVSAAAGIEPPIGPVSTNFRDLEALRRSTRALARRGYLGRACIHPTQVAVVHEVFTPSQDEVQAATDVVEALETSLAQGSGVALDSDGRMIDLAVVRQARRVLARADADSSGPAVSSTPSDTESRNIEPNDMESSTIEPIDIEPDYVTTAAGQVHLRRAGRGAPVLLVHDAPGSSRTWPLDLVTALADHRTVLMPDLIGFGASPMDDADAADIDLQADVLAQVLRALGAEQVPVLGEGAGAVVAERLQARHPDLVCGVVSHLLPHGAQEESFEAAPEGQVPNHAGTHQVALFDELRDSFLFRPWWRRDTSHRSIRPLPDPLTLHRLFVDTASHADAHRRLATSAAQRARGERSNVEVVSRTSEGVLDAATLTRLLLDLVPQPMDEAGPLDGDEGAAAVPGPGTTDARVLTGSGRRYVETSTGRVHVRLFGPADGDPVHGRPVLLLHANPGSGHSLEPLGRALGASRQVIIWDTPGHGLSDPLPDEFAAKHSLTLDATYAPVLGQVLDGLGVATVDVYGTHTGAGLAAELAIAEPDRVGAVVLDGVPLFDDDPDLVQSVLANYFVDLGPDTQGSQLRRAWVSSADMALWWPWFNHTTDGARMTEPYSVEMLDGVVVDMLRSAPHYDRSYRAAWGWRGSERLPLVTQPVLIGSTLSDPLAAMTPTALRLLPHGAKEAVFHPLGAASSTDGNAQIITTFLDGEAR
ncbi:MAG: aldolase/citrate lyase family protein [Knoellia sp.]